ncbi:unnamed protein product [Cylicocyclus nassatus]|uniref:Uncharacterized protein n=1 Tax=Cylicocyclus nassatus TaxID=53992 RepID=A0AA36GX23_CYLNA|nr:unnamed protein product [Cylicocyclus nassatus]
MSWSNLELAGSVVRRPYNLEMRCVAKIPGVLLLEQKTHYSSSSSAHNSKAKRATKPLNNGRNYLCSLCRGPHYTHLCRKPLPFSYRASILLVKRQLCPKCVRKHHLSACNDTVPCEYCGSSDHATVLCQHLSV